MGSRMTSGRLAAAVAAALTALVLATAAGASREADAASAARGVDVSVYFPRGPVGTSCTRVLPRTRDVVVPGILRGALTKLLEGPTAAERRLGYGGWFSARTAGMLRSVRIADGVAYADFRDLRRVIPNASSSCGSALLLAQLDRTATQFRTVRRAVYSINGNRRAFYEWLQRPAPR